MARLMGRNMHVSSAGAASCSGRGASRLFAGRAAPQGRSARHATQVPPFRLHAASLKTQALTGVSIEVEKTSWNSRRVFASIGIATPVEVVWSALTDYENLATFIPSLVENRCLERKSNGAVLYQVGAQDVAMGIKFTAACTLSCEEYGSGVPAALLSNDLDSAESCFPCPPRGPGTPARDIAFSLVEGDFQTFRGVWRMQSLDGAGVPGSSTLLSYALYVKPQSWLPVGIIQSRIEKEVVRNLEAVSKYAEARWSSRASAGAQASTAQAAAEQ